MICDHEGQDPWWECDARGIPLAKVCANCMAEKLKVFRPEVLTNPQYEVDEPIDEEDY